MSTGREKEANERTETNAHMTMEMLCVLSHRTVHHGLSPHSLCSLCNTFQSLNHILFFFLDSAQENEIIKYIIMKAGTWLLKY